MRIDFGDLIIGETAKKYLQKAIDKNWASEGDNVKQFEEDFAKLFGYKHAIATSSGTDADIVACVALYDFGAERGDEIIVPALSFVSTANSILAAGFTPKFVDIALETLNIDPSKIEEAITDKTRAIMVVHTMGKPCEMDTILKIAEKYDLKQKNSVSRILSELINGGYVHRTLIYKKNSSPSYEAYQSFLKTLFPLYPLIHFQSFHIFVYKGTIELA